MNESQGIPTGKVLITGATGHVGANLMHRLLDEGQEVRCVVEPGSDRSVFDGLDVEVVEGDIRDLAAMKRATKGITRVFHVAAKISTLNPGAGEQRTLYDINVMGTRNVLRASMDNGVARAVVTGSFSATGYDAEDPSHPSSEDAPFYPFDEHLPYARTKVLTEHETLRAVVDGFDAVIATSCACIGPHDHFPSRMGRTMQDFVHGRLRAYIDGGFDFVRAADIVQGHMLAMEKGRKGQKYIFSTHFHTLAELMQMWSDVTGIPPIKLKLPAPVMASLTGVVSGVASRVLPNVQQRLTPGAIRILRMRRRADTTKAREELGYQPTSIAQAVREAFEFFERSGKVPAGTVKGTAEPAAATHAAAE
jgi:nucleoside-diphosphate-sugar epimerase